MASTDERILLGRDAVHVWSFSLDAPAADVASLYEVLDPLQRGRAARFLRPLDGDRFVVAHGRLREVLARYLGCAPAVVPLHAADGEAPSVRGAPLRVSLSHSHGRALVAVAHRAVGVDLEKLRPELATLEAAAIVFAPGELDALRALPPSRRARAFFTGWTRKEAYLKARGDGFRFPPRGCAVALEPAVERALLAVDGEPEEPRRFAFRDLSPFPGYVGSLAAQVPLDAVTLFDLDIDAGDDRPHAGAPVVPDVETAEASLDDVASPAPARPAGELGREVRW